MSLHTILRHQICAAIVLSVVQMMTHGVYGRPDFGLKRHTVPPGLLLGELLADTNEEQYVSELQKYQRHQPNYITKWPALRDLLMSIDYDDDTTEDTDTAYNRFVDRLHKLTASPMDMEEVRDETSIQNMDSAGSVDEPMTVTMLPLRQLASAAGSRGYRAALKQRDVKKNVQYMSPCHFKICNMGRKRNARYFYKY